MPLLQSGAGWTLSGPLCWNGSPALKDGRRVSRSEHRNASYDVHATARNATAWNAASDAAASTFSVGSPAAARPGFGSAHAATYARSHATPVWSRSTSARSWSAPTRSCVAIRWTPADATAGCAATRRGSAAPENRLHSSSGGRRRRSPAGPALFSSSTGTDVSIPPHAGPPYRRRSGDV